MRPPWSRGVGDREFLVSPNVFIRVLGPIDVVADGSVVPISGHHTRLVLGTLVVSLAHAVAAEHLAFVVWGDTPPPSAATSLQSLVSRLRSVLGVDAITYTNGAYILTIDANLVDAVRFERMALAAGECLGSDPERAGDLCRQALALWRGAPFGDVADNDFAHLEAIRLDELRMTTMELQLEADLALHRERWVTPTLEAAVEEYPYREGLWVLLVRALIATNRRRDAVDACARLRLVLAEIGLEPGPDMRHLETELFSPRS